MREELGLLLGIRLGVRDDPPELVELDPLDPEDPDDPDDPELGGEVRGTACSTPEPPPEEPLPPELVLEEPELGGGAVRGTA